MFHNVYIDGLVKNLKSFSLPILVGYILSLIKYTTCIFLEKITKGTDRS